MEQNASRWVRIVIPILIVVVIGVMWFVKNGSSPSSAPEITDLGADFSLNATEAVDFEVLAEHGLPVIIDYGADSCIPCKQMAPVLKKLNEEMQGKAFIKFVDVWQYPDAAANAPVQVIPTQVIFNADGTPFVPSDELAAQVQFTMYSHRDTNEHIFTVHQGGLTEEQMRLILAEMGVE